MNKIFGFVFSLVSFVASAVPQFVNTSLGGVTLEERKYYLSASNCLNASNLQVVDDFSNPVPGLDNMICSFYVPGTAYDVMLVNGPWDSGIRTMVSKKSGDFSYTVSVLPSATFAGWGLALSSPESYLKYKITFSISAPKGTFDGSGTAFAVNQLVTLIPSINIRVLKATVPVN